MIRKELYYDCRYLCYSNEYPLVLININNK